MQICQSLVCVWDWTGRNAATVIAIAALLCSVWTALLSRLNARMVALPLLHPFQRPAAKLVRDHLTSTHVEGTLEAELRNGGLGPAYVTKYQAFLNGQPVDLLNKKRVEASLSQGFQLRPEQMNPTWFFLEGAIAVPRDDKIESLKLFFTVPDFDEFDRIVERIGSFKLRVEYQSMYGDELLFDSEVPSVPPKLRLFRLHKRS
jgi:hypothetical protein